MIIIDSLKSYKDYSSRLRMLENEKRNILFEIKCIDDNICYMPGRTLLPGGTKKPESVVEKIVVEKEAKEGKKKTLLNTLEYIDVDIEYYTYRIGLIDALLCGLEKIDRFIISHHYIEKMTWEEVREAYEKENKTMLCIRTIYNRAKKATEYMQKKMPP